MDSVDTEQCQVPSCYRPQYSNRMCKEHNSRIFARRSGSFARVVPLGTMGYECPHCGGRFANLRYHEKTIPRHYESIMTRAGVTDSDQVCSGSGEKPVEGRRGHYTTGRYHAVAAQS